MYYVAVKDSHVTANLSLWQEIYKDRKKFSEQVFKVASSDLVNMGISVVSYTLKDVHDDQVLPKTLWWVPGFQRWRWTWMKTYDPVFSLCSGLPAVTGKGSYSPGSERRSHRRGPEQERCCDQGEIYRFVLLLYRSLSTEFSVSFAESPVIFV